MLTYYFNGIFTTQAYEGRLRILGSYVLLCYSENDVTKVLLLAYLLAYCLCCAVILLHCVAWDCIAAAYNVFKKKKKVRSFVHGWMLPRCSWQSSFSSSFFFLLNSSSLCLPPTASKKKTGRFPILVSDF